MAINKSEVSYGFWVGLGLLLAFLAWGVVSGLIGAIRGR